MDEATPHLHIDFVPFIAGSNRGLDTRVSLKQALAAQGFFGGSRQETEWNQWVVSEKNQLAVVMERHGVEWEQKGTHEKHLSVLDYTKKMRSEEVLELEARVENLQTDEIEKGNAADKAQKRLENIKKHENLVGENMYKYDNSPEWQLPEPKMLMYADTYKTKMVEPFIKRLKTALRSVLTQYFEMASRVNDLKQKLVSANATIERLTDRVQEVIKDNTQLSEIVKDYKRVRNALGNEKVDEILLKAKDAEVLERERKPKARSRNSYER